MNTLNLTCQKTHILAWLNSDDTLSLKINGVKYFASSRTDKRGGKYWKLDGLLNQQEPAPVSSLSKEELELVRSYQHKIKERWPEEGISLAEWEAYQKWQEEKKARKHQSPNQKAVETLKNEAST